jgi:hypothetical protein
MPPGKRHAGTHGVVSATLHMHGGAENMDNYLRTHADNTHRIVIFSHVRATATAAKQVLPRTTR